jgi:hypothetical protein
MRKSRIRLTRIRDRLAPEGDRFAVAAAVISVEA